MPFKLETQTLVRGLQNLFSTNTDDRCANKAWNISAGHGTTGEIIRLRLRIALWRLPPPPPPVAAPSALLPAGQLPAPSPPPGSAGLDPEAFTLALAFGAAPFRLANISSAEVSRAPHFASEPMMPTSPADNASAASRRT